MEREYQHWREAGMSRLDPYSTNLPGASTHRIPGKRRRQQHPRCSEDGGTQDSLGRHRVERHQKTLRPQPNRHAHRPRARRRRFDAANGSPKSCSSPTATPAVCSAEINLEPAR
jgi:hypothetical protein